MNSTDLVKRYTALLAVASALLSIACGEVTGSAGEMPREAAALAPHTVFETVTGWSDYRTATRSVITNEAAWAVAWARLHAHVTPVPQRPDIDFGASVLVLAAMGARSTGGYTVAIREVKSHRGTLYVSVLERSPGPACVTTQAVTAPVHVVEVPRHGTQAHFTVARETYSC